MDYDCLVKDGKLIVAKPKGWKWSVTELKEFDLTSFSRSIIATEDEDITLANGVKAKLSEVDRGLINEKYFVVENAKKLLAAEKYIISKAVK